MANLQELPQYNQRRLMDMMTMMSETEKNTLEQELAAINLEEVKALYEEVYVNRHIEAPAGTIQDVEAEIKGAMSDERLKQLDDLGRQAIQQGKFAALLMAGGQGTRLAHPGPKGTFSFDHISLFEMQAKQLLALNAQLNVTIPWYIMTSDINHEETLQFFEANEYFNYDRSKLIFFKQPNIVALSKEGELLLNKDHELLKAPNGNGGVFEALAATGIYDEMNKNGIQYIFLNNIDNVLVRVMDPVLCGLAVESGAQVTTKTIAPLAGESVGRVIMADGTKRVMEYTELPDTIDAEKFNNANIGIHIFRLDFLMDVQTKALPYHLAIKNLEQLDDNFEVIKAETLKFEKFYFDVFSYADRFATLQVERESEFSPLKNKEGKDSIETARRSLINNGIL